ncbi:orotidine-5'-phosphate decarboxylase [Limnochorda pilosa]|uniref:Orotidine 5'-phosphate decarboxylase n=1 Tax=Limnochorda pilosa TaxID=1555112 RepID=A0A0K2SG08_LIMPI|nr:orotidine-5'-phosphate decarboxylase [Limnochorda pilosa]BAS25972.1 orotidine 5'-phosphate decarboxylase [Limnochorda pilosa]
MSGAIPNAGSHGASGAATLRPSPYVERLHQAVEAKGAPLLLGLDPHLDRIPACFRSRPWPAAGRGDAGDPRMGTGTPGAGRSRPDSQETRARRAVARTYLRWAEAILPAAAPYVAGVKIQAAFYEEAGWAGAWALERTAALARELGLLVVLDVKRGDVPSTAAAYARAWLDGPLGADAVTLHPWLGSDSLEPFLERVRTNGRGLYLLVLPSNPGASELQELPTGATGEPLYRVLARRVAAWADATDGDSPWSSVGAVVGATRPDRVAELRRLMPRVPFLLPGVGAQGGRVETLGAAFSSGGRGAVVTASRSVLFGDGLSPPGGTRPAVEAAREVASRAKELRDRLAALVMGHDGEEVEPS